MGDSNIQFEFGKEEIQKNLFGETLENPLHVQVAGNHYKHFVIQPIEYITANQLPYIEGNVVKYISRWRDKGGISDLLKIKHYVDLLIQAEKKRQEQTCL